MNLEVSLHPQKACFFLLAHFICSIESRQPGLLEFPTWKFPIYFFMWWSFSATSRMTIGMMRVVGALCRWSQHRSLMHLFARTFVRTLRYYLCVALGTTSRASCPFSTASFRSPLKSPLNVCDALENSGINIILFLILNQPLIETSRSFC